MRLISGIVISHVSLKDDAEITNSIFCNFNEGAISSEVLISIYLDSCFFEEDINWINGGAIHVSNAKNMIISKTFAKACCTKTHSEGFAAGQFAYIYLDAIGENNFLMESCISSCSPFTENNDRRSVLELGFGNIQAENVNFSNNYANSQVLFTMTKKNCRTKYITLYRNTITTSILYYNIFSYPIYEKNQFIMNVLLNTNEERLFGYFISNSIVTFKNCCIKDCENCGFYLSDDSSVLFEDCFIEHQFNNHNNVKYSGTMSDVATLVHPLMREVIQNVLKKGYCSVSKELPAMNIIIPFFCSIL